MEYGKRKGQSTSYRLPTHFRLQEDENILSITHEQEQPAYKLEYHYINYVKNQNTLPKKVYVIREDDVDVFYYVMLLPEEY